MSLASTLLMLTTLHPSFFLLFFSGNFRRIVMVIVMNFFLFFFFFRGGLGIGWFEIAAMLTSILLKMLSSVIHVPESCNKWLPMMHYGKTRQGQMKIYQNVRQKWQSSSKPKKRQKFQTQENFKLIKPLDLSNVSTRKIKLSKSIPLHNKYLNNLK